MKQQTLDILDAELRSGQTRYAGSTIRDRVKFYERKFMFDPTRWGSLHTAISQHALTWQEFRFQEAVANNDLDSRIQSTDPGLYIFYVRPDNLVYRFPQMALYVGITDRALRVRLREYMNLETIRKRDNVHQMLQLYYDHVWVAFSQLTLTRNQLRQLETNIHDFIGPPFGRSAYSAETKSARSAWDV